LANLTKLQSIKLSTDTIFSLITDDGVNRLIYSNPNLNDIEFSFQPMINLHTLSALKLRAKNCPSTDFKFICGNNNYGTKKVYPNLYVDHYTSLIYEDLNRMEMDNIRMKTDNILGSLPVPYYQYESFDDGKSSRLLEICAQVISERVADIFKNLLSLEDRDLYLYIRYTISQYQSMHTWGRIFNAIRSQLIHEALRIVEKLAQLDKQLLKRINKIITSKLPNKVLINNQFIKSSAQILGQVYRFIDLKLYVTILSLVQLHAIPTLYHYICYTIPILVIS
jgi:hypothetical protein